MDRRTLPAMDGDERRGGRRPTHPRWPAVILLVMVMSLLFGLAVLDTFGQL